VLAAVCGIDLSEANTPDGAAFRSSAAALATDVIRDDVAGVRSYLLHCERSSGQYLFDALLTAGHDFGIQVDGFVTPGI
jgi:sarcosine oxidase gamma subunit